MFKVWFKVNGTEVMSVKEYKTKMNAQKLAKKITTLVESQGLEDVITDIQVAEENPFA